jgi:hypothetical protein
MKRYNVLFFALLVGCTASEQPRTAPSPRFDRVRGEACAREEVNRRLIALGERVLTVETHEDRRFVEEALDECGFPPGSERYLATQSLWLATNSMRFEIGRPYRERRNEAAARENAERSRRRQAEIEEASRRYLLCVQAAAVSLATSSAETATVIADAATGSCPTEAEKLALADWQMKAALDTHFRAPLLAQILRARER